MSRSLPPSSAKTPWQVPAVLAAGVVGELAAAVAFSQGALSLAAALIIHSIVATLLVLGAWRIRRRPGARLAVLAAVGILLFGPFGAAGALLAGALVLAAGERDFAVWYSSLFPADVPDPAGEACDRLTAGRDLMPDSARVTSFWDVLAHGSIDQQLTVVALMSRHYRAAFGPVLLCALHHGAPAVRVQAASAVAHLEELANEGQAKLTAKIEDGFDPFGTWLALARHYDDWAHDGLMEADRQRQYRLKALEAYRRCLEWRPGEPGVINATARCLLRLEQFAEAAELLANQPETGEGAWQGRLWYGECLYRLGRLGQLGRLLAHMPGPAEGEGPAVLPQVREMWTRQGKVEELPA